MERQAHPYRCAFGGGQQHPVAAKVLERGGCSDRLDQPGKAPLADQHAREKMVTLEPGDIPRASGTIDRRERERGRRAAIRAGHRRGDTRTLQPSSEGWASKRSPSGPVRSVGTSSGP